jgi:CRISPR-associated protein Csd2
MFDHDRSASRGLMAPRKLIVFKHQSSLGNAPAHKLFEALNVKRNDGVETPRAFTDYTVTLDRSTIPATVEVSELL